MPPLRPLNLGNSSHSHFLKTTAQQLENQNRVPVVRTRFEM
jgi:hypothetical protein